MGKVFPKTLFIGVPRNTYSKMPISPFIIAEYIFADIVSPFEIF